MKECLIFLFFSIFDFVIWVILLNTHNNNTLVATFLPLIFLEIAFFGCVLLYKMDHIDKGGDEDE